MNNQKPFDLIAAGRMCDSMGDCPNCGADMKNETNDDDNDLIRHEADHEQIQQYLSKRNKAFTELMERLYLIPAVPQEMTAREYLETEARMSKYYGLPCTFDVAGFTVDEEISMIEKFAREHPERSEE